MCVYSMMADDKFDQWKRRYWPDKTWPDSPYTAPPPPVPHVPFPTQLELDEFRRLLEKAREYDKKNKQCPCEEEQKKEFLRQAAKALGIDISFIDEEAK